MKKYTAVIILLLCIVSCSKESNLTVSGEIKDLKKGTIYLQKVEDTSLVNIDSIVVNGDPGFTFETYIDEPQMLYLYLNKIDNQVLEDRIGFFAEKGEMTVNTSLKEFGVDLTIEGSENQKKLEEFQSIIKRFNEQNLEIIKTNIDAERDQNDSLITEASKRYNNLLKRKYLYTINFAVTNKDMEVAPYITLSEAYDANIQYLDTVYNSLTPRIQKSLYGKELKDFIKERKELEENPEAFIETEE